MNQAFKEYVGKQMKQKDKPSIMEKLTHFKEIVAKGKNRERTKQHQKDRAELMMNLKPDDPRSQKKVKKDIEAVHRQAEIKTVQLFYLQTAFPEK